MLGQRASRILESSARPKRQLQPQVCVDPTLRARKALVGWTMLISSAQKLLQVCRSLKTMSSWLPQDSLHSLILQTVPSLQRQLLSSTAAATAAAPPTVQRIVGTEVLGAKLTPSTAK
eukprot:6472157-Amphidinium_carterae.1